MNISQITPYTLFFKSIVLGVVFAGAFLFGNATVRASSTTWYVNPVGGTCQPDDGSPLPPGWSIYETCSNVEQGTGCTNIRCSPTTNDTYNPTGAVATIGASISKNTFTPRERGNIIIIGSLGSYTGSEIANALLFYNLGNPILNGITCFFFSCPVTRQVSGSATIPFKDTYGFTTYPEPPAGDRTGYGFERGYTQRNADTGQTLSWTGYFDRFWRDQKGSFYAEQSFIAPLTPGNYTVDLVGCHEKYYCVTPAPLNFTVSAPIQVGSITVVSNIDGASYTITGPATIPGGGRFSSFSSQPVGTYTITWNDVAGYTKPAPTTWNTQALTSGDTINFAGAYTAPPTIDVHF